MKDHASPEAYFAQHLASNDTKVRHRAVKKLRAWLTFRSTAGTAFTQEDMLKIWKGLYYCMWMCDKPLNQEHLADNISDLVHCFAKPQSCMLFIDTFFQSMSKEWHGIDRYRIEKFLLLVRRFLCQCFCLLSKHQWKPKLIAKLLKVLKKHALNPEVNDTPAGLKMHIMDIYLDELAKAGGCDLKPKRFTRFIRPYIIYLTECHDNVQLGSVVKEIFHPLIWQAFHEDEDEAENDDEEETVIFQVDFNYIADLLLKRVTEKQNLKGGNRNRIYKLIAELRSAAEGEFPFAKVESDDDHEDFAIKKSDINKAARALVESDLKLKEEKRKRLQEMRQKRKRKHHSEESESEGETFQEELMSKIKFKESDRLTNKAKGKKKPMKRKSKTKKDMKVSGKKSVKKSKQKNNQ